MPSKLVFEVSPISASLLLIAREEPSLEKMKEKEIVRKKSMKKMEEMNEEDGGHE